MKDFLRFIVGFLPWISFGVLAGPSLLRLEIAILVSLALTVIVGFGQLKKGFILTWGTLLFFAAIAVLVILMKNVWTMTHMGLLAPSGMAAIAWFSLAIGKPFVAQFARENAPVDRWNHPQFIASCRCLTIVWGCLFLVSTALAFAKYFHVVADWASTVLSIASVVFGIAYTEWYKKKARENAK
ncbi:MAG: hypothetical protein ABIK45_10050 [Pseudomonadota bacterium]